MRFTTESGATYLLDEEEPRIMRLGPFSPGLDYDSVPDDQWDYLTYCDPVEIGLPVYMQLSGGRFRQTTRVVEIDKEEDD